MRSMLGKYSNETTKEEQNDLLKWERGLQIFVFGTCTTGNHHKFLCRNNIWKVDSPLEICNFFSTSDLFICHFKEVFSNYPAREVPCLGPFPGQITDAMKYLTMLFCTALTNDWNHIISYTGYCGSSITFTFPSLKKSCLLYNPYT